MSSQATNLSLSRDQSRLVGSAADTSMSLIAGTNFDLNQRQQIKTTVPIERHMVENETEGQQMASNEPL